MKRIMKVVMVAVAGVALVAPTLASAGDDGTQNQNIGTQGQRLQSIGGAVKLKSIGGAASLESIGGASKLKSIGGAYRSIGGAEPESIGGASKLKRGTFPKPAE